MKIALSECVSVEWRMDKWRSLYLKAWWWRANLCTVLQINRSLFQALVVVEQRNWKRGRGVSRRLSNLCISVFFSSHFFLFFQVTELFGHRLYHWKIHAGKHRLCNQVTGYNTIRHRQSQQLVKISSNLCAILNFTKAVCGFFHLITVSGIVRFLSNI